MPNTTHAANGNGKAPTTSPAAAKRLRPPCATTNRVYAIPIPAFPQQQPSGQLRRTKQAIAMLLLIGVGMGTVKLASALRSHKPACECVVDPEPLLERQRAIEVAKQFVAVDLPDVGHVTSASRDEQSGMPVWDVTGNADGTQWRVRVFVANTDKWRPRLIEVAGRKVFQDFTTR